RPALVLVVHPSFPAKTVPEFMAYAKASPGKISMASAGLAVQRPVSRKHLHAAIKGLTRLARKRGVRLRQSYVRIAKRAAMMAGRYAHAKQFNRLRRQLRLWRTRRASLSRDRRARTPGKAYPAAE